MKNYLKVQKGKQYNTSFISEYISSEGAGRGIRANKHGVIDDSLYKGDLVALAAVASTNLPRGCLVNLFFDSELKARPADAKLGRPANGFISESATEGAVVSIRLLGSIHKHLNGLVEGTTYFLGENGVVIDTPYDSGNGEYKNYISQKIGKACSDTELITSNYIIIGLG